MYTPRPDTPNPSAPEPPHSLGVTIVIPVFNGLDYTRRCLKTLRETTPQDSVKVVIVDNGSTDGTASWLATQPDLSVIRLESNHGFVHANNLVLKELQGGDQDVLLLNNDTELLQKGWLDQMRAVAYSTADIGVVGCLQLGSDGKIRHAGTYMSTHTWRGWTLGANQKDTCQFHGVQDVEGVIGSCMLIRRDVLNTVGVLHEGYHSYYEDTDYCLCCREAGYRVVVDLDTRILHHENTTTEINQIDFTELYEGSRDVFRSRWERKIEDSYTCPLIWQSIVNEPSGYGRSSRELVTQLDAK